MSDSTPASTTDRATAWALALDELEGETARLEAIDAGSPVPDPVPWVPPADLGPLPQELAPRARELLVRQQVVLAVLAGMLSGNRQQARMAGLVHAATGTQERPAYLDVRA